jgi:WD40 repeat protein
MSSSRLVVCGLAFLILPATVAIGQTPRIIDPAAGPLPEGALLRMGSTRLAHGTWLTCVRFSADDQWIGAADSNGVVRLWETATGRLVWEKPQRTGRTLAFSPDGKTLAISGFYNREITLWDLQKNEFIRELPQNARSMEFSKDGAMLAAAGQDAIVRLWDPRTGAVLKEFKGHQGALYAVAISSDGRLLASGGGGDGTAPGQNEVRLWDVATGKEIAQLHEDEGRQPRLRGWVYSIDFSPDAALLAVASPYAVRIWDVARRKQIHCLSECSHDAAFSPVANRLALPGDFGIYDPQSGQQVAKLSGDVDVYGCVAYSHNGRLIASGNKDGYVQLWDATTGRELVRRWGHEGGIRCVAFSPDGTLAASLSREDETIRVWGTASGKQLLKIPVTWRGPDVWWSEEGSDVLFAPYGREIITWTYDSTVRYWEFAGLEKRSMRLANASSTAMAFSKDGTHAALVEYNGGSRSGIGVYELDGGTLVASLDPFGGKASSDAWVSSLAFSPDGNTLAVGVLKDTLQEAPAPSVQLWDIESKALHRSLRPAIAPPGKVCFSPDGTLLATSAVRGSPLELWRMPDGQEVGSFKVEADAHGRDPAPLAFSPDGKLLAAADASREIYIWELATRDRIRVFRGHQKAVTSLAFSPDGRTLLSGSEDATMLLWDVSGAGRAAVTLTPKQLADYWDALADADSDIAAGAIEVLLGTPQQAVELLDQRLTPGEVHDVDDLPKLIAELGGDDVRAALASAVRLKAYGVKASPALFKALAERPSPAVRRRIEDVLKSIGEFPIPPETLRRTRAIQVLERIGSEDAVRILKRLAEANPSTTSSLDAQEALERLERRSRAPMAKLAPGR